jgi:hypothetical protein
VVEFVWTPQDAQGNDLDASPAFASQEEAEVWMGTEWAALLEAGAEYVKLTGDGRFLYRMGLRA